MFNNRHHLNFVFEDTFYDSNHHSISLVAQANTKLVPVT